MVSIHQQAFAAIKALDCGEYWLLGTSPFKLLQVVPANVPRVVLPGGVAAFGRLVVSSEAPECDTTYQVTIWKQGSSLETYLCTASGFEKTELRQFNKAEFTLLYTIAQCPVAVLNSEAPPVFVANTMFGSVGSSIKQTKSSYALSFDMTRVPLLFKQNEPVSRKCPVLHRHTERIVDFSSLSWCSVFDGPADFNVHKSKLEEIVSTLIRLRAKHCYCFNNDYSALPFNVVYSTGDELERRSIHEMLQLPLDWPLVRPECVITSEPGVSDVHLPLLNPLAKDIGTKFAVRGHYHYFHYRQDGFDDRGWGCAYRSLQTLVSWLRLQHFTQKPVPDLRTIQYLLEEIGDKPAGFVNSKEWIGAFEVMLVIDHYCGITSRILNFNSGAEIKDRVRELAMHFEDEGSPVMIGGGVLAYTLLGVQYNEDTGESKYLILDPHYVGNDVPKTILEKGWCAWKGPEIFRADAHYNFCIPIRPKHF